MSVLAVIKIDAKPGRGDTLVIAMGEPVRLTQENPECTRAELYRSTARPDELVLIEQWTSIAAHHAHFESLGAAGAVADCAELWAGPPASVHYRQTEE